MVMIWRSAVRRLRLYRQRAFMAQGARSIGLQQRVAITVGEKSMVTGLQDSRGENLKGTEGKLDSIADREALQ